MDIEYKTLKSKRKTLCIQITPDGNVLVRAPLKAAEKDIDAFVRDHIGWIEKKTKELIKRKEKRAGTSPVIPFTPAELSKYTKLAKELIPQKCVLYANLLHVSFNKVTIRRSRTNWGSCSARGNLNFNVLLMLVPEDILDYIIVHELCHRKQMNHSKAFWELVGTLVPDYKEKRKWLKENGDALIERLPGSNASTTFYTYILSCSDNSLYIGYTNNLSARLAAHNSGKGAVYTRYRRPVKLVYHETYSTKSEAMSREALLKQLSRREKIQLIEEYQKSQNEKQP